jgi:hypothetical protein
MIPYDIAYALLDDVTMQKRVLYARLRTAAFMLIEDPATPNHAARIAWANKALNEGLQMTLRQLMLHVITDPNVSAAGAAATDAQLQGAVDALQATMVAGG